jgi:hypothetical protein
LPDGRRECGRRLGRGLFPRSASAFFVRFVGRDFRRRFRLCAASSGSLGSLAGRGPVGRRSSCRRRNPQGKPVANEIQGSGCRAVAVYRVRRPGKRRRSERAAARARDQARPRRARCVPPVYGCVDRRGVHKRSGRHTSCNARCGGGLLCADRRRFSASGLCARGREGRLSARANAGHSYIVSPGSRSKICSPSTSAASFRTSSGVPTSTGKVPKCIGMTIFTPSILIASAAERGPMV